MSIVDLSFLAGRFLVLEGMDGCGKTTITKQLTAEMSRQAVPFETFHEPGTTRAGEEIRRLLLQSGASEHQQIPLDPKTEVLLFSASRSQLVAEVLAPAMAARRAVIADRFWLSTLAYQSPDGVWDDAIVSLHKWLLNDCFPDVTVVLDAPVETVRQRSALQKLSDRFESRPDSYYEKLRQRYLQLAEKQPEVVVVDATGSVEENVRLVVEAARSALNNKPSTSS